VRGRHPAVFRCLTPRAACLNSPGLVGLNCCPRLNNRADQDPSDNDGHDNYEHEKRAVPPESVSLSRHRHSGELGPQVKIHPPAPYSIQCPESDTPSYIPPRGGWSAGRVRNLSVIPRFQEGSRPPIVRYGLRGQGTPVQEATDLLCLRRATEGARGRKGPDEPAIRAKTFQAVGTSRCWTMKTVLLSGVLYEAL
jgi:hypothetical protein